MDAASKEKNKSILQELIVGGDIDVNGKNKDGTNLLQNAVEDNDMETACMLLYYGADVNIANELNQKPLNIALNNHNLNIALMLANFYDDLNSTNMYSTLIALLSKKTVLSDKLLSYSNAEEILVKYFKLFLAKFSKELVLNYDVRFLADFLLYCDYSGPHFLECLNIILQFPNSQLFLQTRNRKYSTQTFHDLLNTFVEKNINCKDRTATIWSWMGFLGGETNSMNVNVAYYFFGHHKEVEALIYTTGLTEICCGRILPLTIFSMALEKELDTAKTFKIFLEYWYIRGIPDVLSFSRRSVDFNSVQIILNSMRYFTIPDNLKKVFFKEFRDTRLFCKKIVEAIECSPRVPSLVELSRDKSRMYIKEAFKIEYPYEFHSTVQKIDIPTAVQDIILFKKPIY